MGVGSGKFCVHLGRANWRNPHTCIITKPATSRSTLTTEYRSCRLCAARLRECVWVKSRSILIHSYCNHPIIHFCPTQFYLDIVKRIVDIAKLERSNFGIEANIPDDIAEVVFSGPMFDTVTEMDWETLFKIYRVVQLDFTPEMELFHILFERCHTKNRKRSLQQHTKYFNFRSKIQLYLPVQLRQARTRGGRQPGDMEPGRGGRR